jgi:hypothetical protein
MAEQTLMQPRCYRADLAITQFNRQTGNEIYLLDLDHAGANIETPFPLSPDYPVEFSFSLPGAPEEINATGRVLWKQQLGVPPGKYHLRVQFYVPRWDLDRLLETSQSSS